MVQMQHDGHRCVFRKMAHHLTEHRQWGVFAATWPGLKDHRRVFSFSSGHIGAHIFPAEANKTANGIAILQGRLKNLSEGRNRHVKRLI